MYRAISTHIGRKFSRIFMFNVQRIGYVLIAPFLFIMSCHSHFAGNTIYPKSNATRKIVPPDKVDWDIDYQEYSPLFYEAPHLKSRSWADPDLENYKFKWNQLDGAVDRRSFTGIYKLNENGYPLNPKGRTGIIGRGLLGRWGPNHAADPIVTRWKRNQSKDLVSNTDTKRPILQLVVIQRRDNGLWALPGGMVDLNEKPFDAAIREFFEEATDSLKKSKENGALIKEKLNNIFSNGENIVNAYVGDPRNTDNAWIETSAFNFHDESGEVLHDLILDAGDDASKAKWIDLDNSINLYATHKEFVHKVVEKRLAHW